MCLISLLSACSGIYGNVVPQSGPSMEQVYDSMSDKPKQLNTLPSNDTAMSINHIQDVSSNDTPAPKNQINNQFRKLPNPALTLYVFPHLAGNEDVPIPGYYTVVNAYTHDHYALQDEVIRG